MTNTAKHIFVIPFSGDLLQKTAGCRVAVRAAGTGEIGSIAAAAGRDRLHCIEVAAEGPGGLELRKEWRALPLVFRLRSAGRILDWMPALESLRASAARFYFPATPENISAARALSSLMVKTGLAVDEGTDWDAMEDLLAYDSCGKVAHTPVEPFLYAYTEYRNPQADYNELYLEREGNFFHCDTAGNVAVSGAALAAGEFIGTLDDIPGLDLKGVSLAASQKRRAPLLKFGGCAVCPAWRVCGFRNAGNGERCGKKQFMTALQDAAIQVNKNADNNI